MKVLQSFLCNKVAKNKGDLLDHSEIEVIGDNLDELIQAGCIEKSDADAPELEKVEEVEEVEIEEEVIDLADEE